MPKRRKPTATIERHYAFCEERRHNLSEIKYEWDTATFVLDSQGEVIEFHYRRHITSGYWRFDYAVMEDGTQTGRKLHTWKAVAAILDDMYESAAEHYWERRNEDFYGSPAPQPSDKPNDPLDRYLDEKGMW